MPSPSTRADRAARLLAVLLVPLVALPALAGLVVCASGGGVTTSWGGKPCPRKQSATGIAVPSPGEVASACVVVPDAPDASLTPAPDLPAPAERALPARTSALATPPAAPVAVLGGPRGPPSGTLGALRTIVLRV